jgi:hypothetical protein
MSVKNRCSANTARCGAINLLEATPTQLIFYQSRFKLSLPFAF